MYDTEKWEKAVAFHGHKCPGIAIGFKTVEALMEHIPTEAASDEQIVCITENDTCAVDAIQSLLSCTIGKGNLIYKPLGKMAFNFYFRESGESIRLYYKGGDKKEFGQDMTREQLMELILNTPSEELFTFGKVKFELPTRARIFNSIACSVCGEKVREDKIRLQNGNMVCLSCFNEYDR